VGYPSPPYTNLKEKLFAKKLYLPDGKLKGQSNKMSRVTATPTELNQLDGAGSGTVSKVAVLDSAGGIITSTNVGTAGTLVTAQEYGDYIRHNTRLVLSAVALPAVAGAGAAAHGVIIYTFPATAGIIIHGASMDLAISSLAPIQADTPDVGLGTVIATGGVATLDGTATFENVITGQTATDCNGTATEATLAPTAGASLALAKGTNKLHFNMADTWAGASATNTVSGVVFIDWSSHVI
jgi:hypothetical protein